MVSTGASLLSLDTHMCNVLLPQRMTHGINYLLLILFCVVHCCQALLIHFFYFSTPVTPTGFDITAHYTSPSCHLQVKKHCYPSKYRTHHPSRHHNASFTVCPPPLHPSSRRHGRVFCCTAVLLLLLIHQQTPPFTPALPFPLPWLHRPSPPKA